MRFRSLLFALLALCALRSTAPRAAEVPPASPPPSAPPAASPPSPAAPPPATPSAAAPTAPPASPAPSDTGVDALYARGVEALKAKDAPAAIEAFSTCTRQAPTRVDCFWELGWSHSTLHHWSEALEAWTTVQKLDPQHAELEDALTQARGQLALEKKLASEGQGKPAHRPAPPKDARLRIRATGDVMLGTSYPEGLLPPDDAAGSLAAVAPLLRDADLTFVNLEGPLCDHGETTKCHKGGHCYAFRVPTRYGQYLKDAGVDVVSTANNHAGDYGALCRRETESVLDGLGIAWSGPVGTTATLERNGLKIGLVAFHTSADTNDVNNLPTAQALVRSLKRDHDLVIVSFHGGAEGSKAQHVPPGTEMFYGENRGNLRVFTHGVIDAGADLVLGHGPHVARALEFYKDKLIVYSMGNFATYGSFNLQGPQALGEVVEVELDGQGRFRSGRLFATRQEGRGIPQPDPSNEVLGIVTRLTQEDFPNTGARIAPDGTVTPRKPLKGLE